MTDSPPEQDRSQASGAGAHEDAVPRAARLRQVGRVVVWPVRTLFSLLRRFWLLLLLLAGVAAFVYYVVLPRVQEEEVVTVPPQPVEAVRQDLLVTVPATGTLDFGTLVQVGFENAGVLTELKVGAGDAVSAGDVVIVPAGVGHKGIEATSDLGIVGAYPAGTGPDLCRGFSGERPACLEAIARVAVPLSDPVYGTAGPLHEHWASV